MRKYFYILISLLVITLIGCKKEESPTNPKTFTFVSLTASKTEIDINEFTDITATATGENLTYRWSCTEGAIFDNGPKVQFSICHATTVRITCIVSDASGNSESKDINIKIGQK
ncbi:MAG: hypothetical protein EPN82_04495 [Bacteroidetes bacterium]|nr:MAG: hypothetical protein EPN82_04495 [Bacteroidota bacterium]